MRLAIALLISSLVSVSTVAETSVTYVGLGRYACSGSTKDCVAIDQNNQRESELRALQLQIDQARTQGAIDRQRREEKERLQENSRWSN